MNNRVPLGTRLRHKETGTLGTYTFGEDYVPGLDAGNFRVTFDRPAKWFYGHLSMSHWTYEEMMHAWEPITEGVAS